MVVDGDDDDDDDHDDDNYGRYQMPYFWPSLPAPWFLVSSVYSVPHSWLPVWALMD